MVLQINPFISDFLTLGHDEFVSKYGHFDVKIPTETDLLNYLILSKNIELMLDKPEDAKLGKELF